MRLDRRLADFQLKGDLLVEKPCLIICSTRNCCGVNEAILAISSDFVSSLAVLRRVIAMRHMHRAIHHFA